MTSKTKLEKVIIFRYTFLSLIGVLIDLQDTALESDHFSLHFFRHSWGSQLTSKTKLEKVIIFRYTFSSLMGVLIDLQDTALESDHFLSLTGDPN